MRQHHNTHRPKSHLHYLRQVFDESDEELHIGEQVDESEPREHRWPPDEAQSERAEVENADRTRDRDREPLEALVAALYQGSTHKYCIVYVDKFM